MVRLSESLSDVPLVGIVRGCPPEHLVAVARGAVAAGMRALEVTLDSPDALRGIAALTQAFPDHAIGAGTVRSADDVERIVDAGAQFVVSPLLDRGVIDAALFAGLEVVPGAASPTEISTAVTMGATMVKVFPAAQLGGPGYLRAIHGVLGQPALVPTGGITADDAAAYLAAGATALGVGSAAFRRELLESGDEAGVHDEVARFVAEVSS